MPYTKVTAGAIAGALTVILIFVVQALTDLEIPAEVASAVTVLLTFAVSYFVPEQVGTS